MLLERLVEQKKALIAYHSEHGLPEMLNRNEWTIVTKLVDLLEAFQRTTKNFSKYTSFISEVFKLNVSIYCY